MDGWSSVVAVACDWKFPSKLNNILNSTCDIEYILPDLGI